MQTFKMTDHVILQDCRLQGLVSPLLFSYSCCFGVDTYDDVQQVVWAQDLISCFFLMKTKTFERHPLRQGLEIK